MSKRPYESDECMRQIKKVVTESMVNENDPTLMNKIYEKTNEALYNGSKKVFNFSEIESTPYDMSMDTDENELEEFFKDETFMDVPVMNESSAMCNALDDEVARIKFKSFDKSDVNRLIRMQRRSPSPFPQEPEKCFKCSANFMDSMNSRQTCLKHIWGFKDNDPVASRYLEPGFTPISNIP